MVKKDASFSSTLKKDEEQTWFDLINFLLEANVEIVLNSSGVADYSRFPSSYVRLGSLSGAEYEVRFGSRQKY